MVTSVTDRCHTQGVTDQDPRWPEVARVASIDGTPVVSVYALIARLQQVTSRAEIDHVCEVLATLTGTPTPVDRQTALTEWRNSVGLYVLAHLQAPETAVDVEAAHLEGLQASQAGQASWRASFAAPAAPAADPRPGAVSRRHEVGKTQPRGIER